MYWSILAAKQREDFSREVQHELRISTSGKLYGPGPLYASVWLFHRVECSQLGVTNGTCWLFPVKQNWCEERENKLSNPGCEFFLALKINKLCPWEEGKGGKGRLRNGWPCSVLLLITICSIRLLTNSLKAWLVLCVMKEGLHLPLLMEERACPAPTWKWGFIQLELEHLASEYMKLKVTCRQLLLTLWVFYMAI